jgi:hypothetical protein
VIGDFRPLFDVGDGAPCRVRRPVACGADCRGQTTLLERGFQYPSLDQVPSPAISCPTGSRLIGVDFSTTRAICEAPDRVGLGRGVYCRNLWQDVTTAGHRREVVIAGTRPCEQFTQYRNRRISLLGTKLSVALVDGYIPSPGERFLIILADEKLEGALAEPERDGRLAVRGGKGTFAVQYYDKGVALTDFRPSSELLDAARTRPQTGTLVGGAREAPAH